MRIGDTPLGVHLSTVLSDPERLHEFTQWFSSELWEIESGADPDIVAFARTVENILFSYLDGDWDERTTVLYLKREAIAAGLLAGPTMAASITWDGSETRSSTGSGIRSLVGTLNGLISGRSLAGASS